MSAFSRPFNPADWYWLVGSDETQVWSSARATYVPVSDDAYGQWALLAQPTHVADEAALLDVLRRLHPAGIGALGPRYVPLSVIRERVTAADKWTEFATAIDSLPAADRWHLLSLAEGVASDDAQAIALLSAIGCEPTEILAA
jgi:hypothetical protein